jgi:hypothetical protein
MKKLFGIFAIAGLLFVACNNKPAEPATEENPTVEQSAPNVDVPVAPAEKPATKATPAKKTNTAATTEEPKKEEPKKEESKQEEVKQEAPATNTTNATPKKRR